MGEHVHVPVPNLEKFLPIPNLNDVRYVLEQAADRVRGTYLDTYPRFYLQ